MGSTNKPVATAELEGLRQFATPTELAYIDALIAHGSTRKAQAALGRSSGSCGQALRAVRIRAAKRGWAPEAGWRKPVLPEGFELHALSDRVDADGKRTAAWLKARQATDPAAQAAAKAPPDHLVKRTATLTDAQGNVRSHWRSTEQAKVDQWESMIKACEAHAARYEGKAKPTPAPKVCDADTVSVYPLGDPHIGMLAWGRETGENFDLKIASEDLRATIDELVAQSPASETAMLVNVGDYFHAEDDNQRTPGHGHKLDVEGRSAKVFELGCELMTWMIDRLLQKHRVVRVWNLPGNHDPMTSRFLAAWLRAWYRAEPRVVIECNLNPYSYFRFGATLFGMTHGENCKPADLPEIMASDAKLDWGQTEWHVWLTGHVHHDQVKDYRDCRVETFRTLAKRDYWHHSKGYRARNSLQRQTHHKDRGLISSGVVDLVCVRKGVA